MYKYQIGILFWTPSTFDNGSQRRYSFYLFYCFDFRILRFQEQIQQEERDIRNRDGEDSVSVRSNAYNPSELSVRPQSTPAPLLKKI